MHSTVRWKFPTIRASAWNPIQARGGRTAMDGSSASLAPLDASVTAILDHQRRDSLGGSAMSEQKRMTRPRGYDVVKRYWALPLYVVLFLLVYAPCIMMTYG